MRKRQSRAHSSPESKGSLNFPGASPFTAWFFSFMHRFMLERADAFSPRSPTATAPCSGPPGSPRPTGPSSTSRHQPPQEAPWRTEALRLRPGLGARAPSSPNPILVPPGGPRDTLKASATHWSDTEVRPRWGPSCSTITAPIFRPGDELWCSRLEAKAISYHIPENCRDSKLEGDCLGGGVPATGIRASPSPAGQWSGEFPGPARLELAEALEEASPGASRLPPAGPASHHGGRPDAATWVKLKFWRPKSSLPAASITRSPSRAASKLPLMSGRQGLGPAPQSHRTRSSGPVWAYTLPVGVSKGTGWLH